MKYISDENNFLLINNKVIYKTSVLPDQVTNISNYHITRNHNHYFLQFNFSNKKIKRQGFKIHISATMKNYQEILNIIFDFCKNNKINFKYISNLEKLYLNLSGSSNLWSTGKFITIYPNDYSNFLDLIKSLYVLPDLRDKEGIFILTDRKYKNSNIIFYRYGVLDGDDKGIYDKNGKKLYEDYKSLQYRLPYFIDEPFDAKMKENNNINSRLIFNKYIPTKALNSKAAGSAFLVKNKQDEKYVLKSAIHGYYDGEVSQIEKLKNEEKNINYLNKYDFIPNYIDSFYEEGDYYLVEEYISGLTVDDFRALPSNDFSLNKDIAQQFATVIIDLISKVDKLHKANIFLGDISSQNILVNTNTNKVYFVDLDQTRPLNKEQVQFFYRTEGFYDDKIQYLGLEEQDNEQLGYLLMSFFCRANMFLKVDHSGKTSIKFFEKFANLNSVPKIFINITKKLIKEPNVDLQKIISCLSNSELNSDIIIDDKGFPYKLLNSLIKTDECSKVDNLFVTNNFQNFAVNDTDNLIFSNELSNLRLYYLENKLSIKKVLKDLKIRNKIFVSLDIFIEGTLKKNRDIQKLSLENIISLIFCCLMVADVYKIDNSDVINKIINSADLLLSNYRVEDDYKNLLGYKENYMSKYLSPYLSDGTAGIMEILIYLKRNFEINKYDTVISEMANNLSKNIMPKNASFYRGLGGIVSELLDYETVFNTDIYNDFIIKMLNCFEYYSIKLNGNTMMIDQSFGNVTTNFKDGNQGIVYVLQKAKHFLGK